MASVGSKLDLYGLEENLGRGGDYYMHTTSTPRGTFWVNEVTDPEMEELLGIRNLTDIDFEAQVYLLKFMAEADNARFDRFCNTLHSIDDGLRQKFLENFVAAGFGEDFGDGIWHL